MSIDAIVLGGGRLIEGKGIRASVSKGLENIGGISTGVRVVKALQGSPYIGKIIYCGERDTSLDHDIINVPTSSEKHFFGTLDHGVSEVRTHQPVLIVAGDLPLLKTTHINELITGLEGCDLEGLNLFYTTNPEIQRTFSHYNPNKRFAHLQEGEVVFSNTFITTKETWMKVSGILQEVLKNGKIEIVGLLKNIDIATLPNILRFLIYSNIKQCNPLIMMYLKSFFRMPSLIHDLTPGFSKQLGENITIRRAHPIFSVDYDRRSQQDFFEQNLQ